MNVGVDTNHLVHEERGVNEFLSFGFRTEENAGRERRTQGLAIARIDVSCVIEPSLKNGCSTNEAYWSGENHIEPTAKS